MTCVLSMTPLYTNACSVFSEDGSDLQNNNCDDYDFNWINTQHTAPGLSDSQRRSTQCRIEASTSSSITCRLEISNGHAVSVFKHDPLNVNFDIDKEPDHEIEDKVVHVAKSGPTDGFQVVSNLVEMCNTTEVGFDQHSSTSQGHSTTSQGHKRKAEEAQINETYIPSKRISPFLNTPKERKDERKKVLKISIKKLKLLDDPELYLRRTVLVNNTMKRLQTEVREEKLRTRKHEMSKKKSFNGYGVLNNNCLSNSYLFDDPFLSGVHEKITDDMTDTLMHNVFHDKPGDAASADSSNNISYQVNTNVESRVDSSQLTSLDISNEISNGLDTRVQENSRYAVQPSINGYGDISNQVSLDNNRTVIPEMSDNRCDELVHDNRCKNNNGIDISKYACHDNCEPMELGIRESASTQNIAIQSSEIDSLNNEHTMLCSRLHLTNSVLGKSTDVQIQYTDTVQKHLHNEKDNSLKTSKSAITDLEPVSENTCGLDLLDLDHKLDQKSLSHSFNTFLSDFDITHSIPVPLSYKGS